MFEKAPPSKKILDRKENKSAQTKYFFAYPNVTKINEYFDMMKSTWLRKPDILHKRRSCFLRIQFAWEDTASLETVCDAHRSRKICLTQTFLLQGLTWQRECPLRELWSLLEKSG